MTKDVHQSHLWIQHHQEHLQKTEPMTSWFHINKYLSTSLTIKKVKYCHSCLLTSVTFEPWFTSGACRSVTTPDSSDAVQSMITWTDFYIYFLLIVNQLSNMAALYINHHDLVFITLMSFLPSRSLRSHTTWGQRSTNLNSEKQCRENTNFIFRIIHHSLPDGPASPVTRENKQCWLRKKKKKI